MSRIETTEPGSDVSAEVEVRDLESAELEVGPIAHGGHCVARHRGRVVFVRHALPGELVRVRLTDTSHDRFWRADATEILRAGADRVQPPCPIAGPGLCGGCDFQHVASAAQRALKATVVTEQLHRLAGIDWDGEVEPVPLPSTDPAGQPDGLGWRTRMRYQTDRHGGFGLRAHRSHEVIGLPAGGCRIAVPQLADPASAPGGLGTAGGIGTAGQSETTEVPARSELQGVQPSDGPAVWTSGGPGAPMITETVGDHRFRLRADGFWQVHPAAASTLLAAVLDGLEPRSGESALDLYCGVGLFAAGLAGAGCRPVLGIESSRPAVAQAAANLHGQTGARFRAGRVDRLLTRPTRGVPARADLVVLDPPRAGAGRDVVTAIAARRPRRIGYVACDPAALARDLRFFAEHGYPLTSLRAFDLFPMTHHVECVAVLTAEQP